MSDIGKVYGNGKELAHAGNVTGAVVRPDGKELAVVAKNGQELAKGNQDLSK